MAVGVGLIWLAAARWNGVPADRSAVSSIPGLVSPPIDPAWDRTEELTAALAAIPAVPPLTLPPAPPGMRWKTAAGGVIDMSDALQGDWTPETRPHLQSVIEYLNTPAGQEALAQIAAIEPGGWRPFGPNGPGLAGMGAVRQAARLFVARARYRHAGLGDVDGALADLEAAYRLTSIAYVSGDLIGVLVALACEDLAYRETRHLARERALSAGQAASVVSAVHELTLDREELWRQTASAIVGELEYQLDRAYTDDGQGNGWLVLSRLDNVMDPTWAAQRRSGAWNLLSPLFNSRRTVAAKISRLRDAYEQAGRVSYGQALSILEAFGGRTSFGIADGPCGVARSSGQPRLLLGLVIHRVASRQAAVATVALSAYRTEHGEYPPSLDDLVARYLEQVPRDPYVDQPLRYVRQGPDAYLLYAVGSNLRDDGGGRHTVGSGTWPRNSDGDRVFSRPRGNPHLEPELVEAKP